MPPACHRPCSLLSFTPGGGLPPAPWGGRATLPASCRRETVPACPCPRTLFRESAPGCSKRPENPTVSSRPSARQCGRSRACPRPGKPAQTQWDLAPASFALCLVVRTGQRACSVPTSAGCPELACPHRPPINPLRSCGCWPRPGISPTRAAALMPPHSLAPAHCPFIGTQAWWVAKESGLQLWVWPPC